MSPPPPRLSEETTNKAQRRFMPEPVETTAKSNRATPSLDHLSDQTKNTMDRRRFAPQPVETTIKSNRKPVAGPSSPSPANITSPSSHRVPPQPAESNSPPVTRRKFSPQLIETTKRSRKNGDTTPTLLHSDKTEFSPGDHLPRHLRITQPPVPPPSPVQTPSETTKEVPSLDESRFSSSNLRRTVPRRHSFRVPDLDPIQSQPDSEDSNDSGLSSLSTSPSAASDETELYKRVTRTRESCDDRFSGYLLALAARAAEKQLRDQAMAAYPNEQLHEPVDHFAVDRESEESDEEGTGMLSRDPDGDKPTLPSEPAAGWDLAELRRHKERLEQQKKPHKTQGQPKLDQKSPTKGRFQDSKTGAREHQPLAGVLNASKSGNGGWQNGAEIKQMRSAASPPMLGDELFFPRCQSPQPTRLDVHQFPSTHRALGTPTPTDSGGLWCPAGGAKQSAPASGLWMGVCLLPAKRLLSVPKPIQQTGLMTPNAEREDPLANVDLGGRSQLPPSPPNSMPDSQIAGIDAILIVEQEIEKEFHDGFVTQVYNYLSLGYPALARKYDPELSKISRVPIEDLRRDDQRANAKGYVGAPEGDGVGMGEIQDGQCGRWLALRLYVREWLRQQPAMVDRGAGANNAWGARARKGSWAI
ncbi:hypothetical protein MMC12_003611 [Toensbergia leucococca]|nr:hypothetical protein [Toensbergia leucococca]